MTRQQGKLITFGLLVIVLGAIVWANLESNKHYENKGREQARKEVQQQLDSFRIEKQLNREQRDSFVHIVDSVRSSRRIDSALLVQKDQEIKSLKGKYNNVPQDSLGIIMDARAGKTHR